MNGKNDEQWEMCFLLKREKTREVPLRCTSSRRVNIPPEFLFILLPLALGSYILCFEKEDEWATFGVFSFGKAIEGLKRTLSLSLSLSLGTFSPFL